MQVVIILVPPRKIALRTSATTSDRYGRRLRHPDKDSYGYVGQITAVGNLPVVELFVEIVKYPLRDIETLFRSAMGRKRVGHRAGTIVSIVHIDGRSLNRFRPMALIRIDLSGKPLPVVEFLPGSGKFGNHQVTGHSQFGSLVFGVSFEDRISTENIFLIFPFIYGIASPGKCLLVFFS